jgi:hypothetical protein
MPKVPGSEKALEQRVERRLNRQGLGEQPDRLVARFRHRVTDTLDRQTLFPRSQLGVVSLPRAGLASTAYASVIFWNALVLCEPATSGWSARTRSRYRAYPRGPLRPGHAQDQIVVFRNHRDPRPDSGAERDSGSLWMATWYPDHV